MKRLLAIALVASLPSYAFAEDYKLGPLDKIRVKAIEWRSGQGEVFEWGSISGEYVVDASGTLMLPLIGAIPAKGRTAIEVSMAVQDQLQKRTGMSTKPDASVEVVQYRPIYIVGDAAHPGEFPFRPGMTVVKALSIAGGAFRAGDAAALVALGRDQITAESAIVYSESEMKRSLLRRGRLLAEMNGADSIGAGQPPETDAELSQMFAHEETILKSRNGAISSKRSSLQELVNLYNQEIATLEAKKATQVQQVELARESRANIANLKKQGLAVNNQTIAAERAVAELESHMLDLENASIQAKQNLNKTQREELDLDADRQARIVLELQDTEKALDELRAKMTSSQGVLTLTSAATRVMSQPVQNTVSNSLSYRITRKGSDDVAFDLEAEENTVVEPGDVIRVTARASELAPSGSQLASTGEGRLTAFVSLLVGSPKFSPPTPPEVKPVSAPDNSNR